MSSAIASRGALSDTDFVGRFNNPVWFSVTCANARPSRADIQFVDFDSVRFHISTPESKTVLLLSMSIQCWPDLAKYGARQSLEAMYAGYILPEAQTEPEYNVSLSIDLERLPTDHGEWAPPIDLELS